MTYYALWSLSIEPIFIMRLLSVVSSGRPLCEILKAFNMRGMVYCVANVWKSVEASTLKNGCHKLWPVLMSEFAAGEDKCDFSEFRASVEKQIIHDLLAFACVLVNPAAKDLASRIDADNVEEWMNIDDDAPIDWLKNYADGFKSGAVSQWRKKQWWKWGRCSRKSLYW